ncbi:cytochrome P450 2C5-like [Liasis olivaceus]
MAAILPSLQLHQNQYLKCPLTEKYGPIFTVWMGPKPLVVLCGYEVVKDALVDHAEEFGGRPDVPFDERVTKAQGIVSKNETKWRELHQFALSTLRKFGMGKMAMSTRLQEEALCLVEEMATRRGPLWSSLFQRKPKEKWLLRLLSELGWTLIWKAIQFVLLKGCSMKRKGNRAEQCCFPQCFLAWDNYQISIWQPFDPKGICMNAASNVICSVIFGNQFDDGDPTFQKQLYTIESDMGYFHSFLGLSHQQTLDPQNPHDFIDCFLIKPENVGQPKASLYNILNASEFWERIFSFIFYFYRKSTKQAPEMEDRVRMPFTNAGSQEILRYEKLSPENFPRAATLAKIREHNIPQGTAIRALLISTHLDPLYWETPEQFNPNHSLDEKGQFRRREAKIAFSLGEWIGPNVPLLCSAPTSECKFIVLSWVIEVSSDGSTLFSFSLLSKRACSGEALPRVELSLFLSTLLQTFTFQLVGDTRKEMDVMSLYEDYRCKN